jgi:hypothetical protein
LNVFEAKFDTGGCKDHMRKLRFIAILLLQVGLIACTNSLETNGSLDFSNEVIGDTKWKTRTFLNGKQEQNESEAEGETIVNNQRLQAAVTVRGAQITIKPGVNNICGKVSCANGLCKITQATTMTWLKSKEKRKTKNIRFAISKAQDHLIPISADDTKFLLCNLSKFDRLVMEFTDQCGVYAITRFKIAGTLLSNSNKKNLEKKKRSLSPKKSCDLASPVKRNNVSPDPKRMRRKNDLRFEAETFLEGRSKVRKGGKQDIQNWRESFTSGNLRLKKPSVFLPHRSISASLNKGKTERLYRQGRWIDLAKYVSSVNHGDDLHYYLLGVSAYKQGSREAARVYLRLSIADSQKQILRRCNPQTCFGIDLPKDAKKLLYRAER